MARASQGNPGQEFWQWFIATKVRLEHYKDDLEAVMDDVHKAITCVHPDLTFEMGPNENGRHDFIISAAGVIDLIPAVVDLYNQAPAIEGWDIIAFRPRAYEYILKYGGNEYSAESVWYESHINDDKLDIVLYMMGIEDHERDEYMVPTYLLLDMTIGEYDVMTALGIIEAEELPKNPASQGLKPLTMLADEVDALVKGRDARADHT